MLIVVITIIIPALFLITKSNLDMTVIPFLIITYILSIMLNKSIHNLYLQKENMKIEKHIKKDIRKEREKKKATVYSLILLLAGVALFIIGNQLGSTLEILCERFNISQVVIGIILGFFTSIPELITFFESQKHHKNQENNKLGMIEATNNLMTSNMINLFVILTIGIILSNIFG